LTPPQLALNVQNPREKLSEMSSSDWNRTSIPD